jgi:hypothetical protein
MSTVLNFDFVMENDVISYLEENNESLWST